MAEERFSNVDKDFKWYVLHTYSGYENIVKEYLENLVENNSLYDLVSDIVIPTEQTIEERNGKKKVVTRKLFPCYVFIKIRYTNDIWFSITNTRGVTGFVGPMGRPIPLSDDEVKSMRLEKIAVDSVDFEIGDTIRVVAGPLKDFSGTVVSVDKNTQKVTVKVSMFGTDTDVQLLFVEVEKIS